MSSLSFADSTLLFWNILSWFKIYIFPKIKWERKYNIDMSRRSGYMQAWLYQKMKLSSAPDEG